MAFETRCARFGQSTCGRDCRGSHESGRVSDADGRDRRLEGERGHVPNRRHVLLPDRQRESGGAHRARRGAHPRGSRETGEGRRGPAAGAAAPHGGLIVAETPPVVMAGPNSLLEEALESWRFAREGVRDELKNIPAERMDFRPTPQSRTVRELVQHILEVSMMMTGELTRPDTNLQRAPWPKLLRMYAMEA